MMQLGPVSCLDCVVFLLFLAPQLLLHVGFFSILKTVWKALPFLAIDVPRGIVHDRLVLPHSQRPPFVRQSTFFEDLVVRCVRYAFANLPLDIGRVFFSRAVVLPFLKFRVLRHGYLLYPIHWEEITQSEFKGIWIIHDQKKEPDIIIYYIHGGGFTLGSPYFYLEFLLTLSTLLSSSSTYTNPAIFALDYTLAPDACFPYQLHQAISAYTFLLPRISNDTRRICLMGDSAGATIILSVLLYLARPSCLDSLFTNRPARPYCLHCLYTMQPHEVHKYLERVNRQPGLAVLISPWPTLVSELHNETRSDFVTVDSLHAYARSYACYTAIDHPVLSPGCCEDAEWWREASPVHGFQVFFGGEELLADDVRRWEDGMKRAGVGVEVRERSGEVHAGVVADLFLKSRRDQRIRGLREVVLGIQGKIGRKEEKGGA